MINCAGNIGRFVVFNHRWGFTMLLSSQALLIDWLPLWLVGKSGCVRQPTSITFLPQAWAAQQRLTFLLIPWLAPQKGTAQRTKLRFIGHNAWRCLSGTCANVAYVPLLPFSHSCFSFSYCLSLSLSCSPSSYFHLSGGREEAVTKLCAVIDRHVRIQA